MTVLAITGGSGRIGTALRPYLRLEYRLRLLDVREPSDTPGSGEEFQRIDVATLSAVEAALDGANAVLHLAGQPNPSST